MKESELDFEEFLDDIAVKNEGVINEESANYYIGRIKRNKANMEMISERAKKILSDYKNKVELWSAKEEERYKQDIEHCLEMLRPYFDTHAKDDKAKLKFPEGTLGFYKTPRSIKLDEKIILKEFENAFQESDFLRMELEKYIELTPSLDKSLLKKEGEVDEETGVFKIKGVPLAGAIVTPEKINFTVR